MALLFTNQTDAQTAIAQINTNMGLPRPGGVTTTWSDALETTDGKWAVPEPDSAFLTGVSGYTVGDASFPIPVHG